MKILFITTGLDPDGAERMLHKLLTHLDKKRFQPFVISLTTKGEIGALIERMGVEVHELRMRFDITFPYKFVRLMTYLIKLEPDLVQTWMYHADLIGGVAARLVGIRHVIWGLRHGNLSQEKNKSSTMWVIRLCSVLSAWLPSAIIACAERVKGAHVHIGYSSCKIIVIPNGFDFTDFQPSPVARESVRVEFGISTDVFLVGMAARYDPQKNHVGFISAANSVVKSIPNVRFLLIGSGIDHKNTKLAKLISEMSLSQFFHLLGHRNDISRLLASLDLNISSSWGEGFPNVLGEAMACGVPCVVTDVGDTAAIVGDTGRVVVPGDMEQLAGEIVELLRNHELRHELGQRARNRALQNYDIRHITWRYQDFYSQVMGRN